MSVAIYGSCFGLVTAVMVYICAATVRATCHASDEL